MSDVIIWCTVLPTYLATVAVGWDGGTLSCRALQVISGVEREECLEECIDYAVSISWEERVMRMKDEDDGKYNIENKE